MTSLQTSTHPGHVLQSAVSHNRPLLKENRFDITVVYTQVEISNLIGPKALADRIDRFLLLCFNAYFIHEIDDLSLRLCSGSLMPG